MLRMWKVGKCYDDDDGQLILYSTDTAFHHPSTKEDRNKWDWIRKIKIPCCSVNYLLNGRQTLQLNSIETRQRDDEPLQEIDWMKELKESSHPKRMPIPVVQKEWRGDDSGENSQWRGHPVWPSKKLTWLFLYKKWWMILIFEAKACERFSSKGTFIQDHSQSSPSWGLCSSDLESSLPSWFLLLSHVLHLLTAASSRNSSRRWSSFIFR